MVAVCALLIISGCAYCAAADFATGDSEFQQQLQQYQNSVQKINNASTFDEHQSVGVEYDYVLLNCSAALGGAWFGSGNNKIAVYNAQGSNVGSIDLANIINNGSIDLMSYMGLTGNMHSAGQLGITYGNDWRFSVLRAAGSASTTNEVLTHPQNGTINSYLQSNLSNSLEITFVDLEKSWNVARYDVASVQLIAGVQAVNCKYEYTMHVAVPVEGIKQNYAGNVGNNITLPLPYLGVGCKINLDTFYFAAAISGLPGVPEFVSDCFGGSNASFINANAAVDYRAADYLTLRCGYGYSEWTLMTSGTTIQKYLGSEFVLPSNFGTADFRFAVSGPFFGINIHL